MRSANRALASSGNGRWRSRIDQRVEIGQATQRFGGDRMGKRTIVAAVYALRGAVERGFERQALAQHGIEQLQRRAAGGNAGRIGRTSRSTRQFSADRSEDAFSPEPLEPDPFIADVACIAACFNEAAQEPPWPAVRPM